MEGKALFRTALFGYKKKDVLDYIESASASAMRETAAARESADYQQKNAEQARLRIYELEKTIEEVREAQQDVSKKLEASLDNTQEAIRDKEALERELERLRDALSVSEKELSYAKEINDSLERRVEDLEKEVSRAMEQKMLIADTVINARGISSAIIDSAKTQAEQSKKDAKQYLENAKEEYTIFYSGVRRYSEDVKASIGGIGGNIDEMMLRLDMTGRELDDVLSALDVNGPQSKAFSQEDSIRRTDEQPDIKHTDDAVGDTADGALGTAKNEAEPIGKEIKYDSLFSDD